MGWFQFFSPPSFVSVSGVFSAGARVFVSFGYDRVCGTFDELGAGWELLRM